MRTLMVAFIAVGLTASVYAVPLDLYNDVLTYEGGGIVATADWNNDETWLSWNIFQTEPDLWRYEYVWHTDGSDLSHITLELTIGAVAADFTNWEYLYAGVESESPEFGWFSTAQGNSNPGMPSAVYGLKLDIAADTGMFGFAFETWRSPVWGDFYAKGGRHAVGTDAVGGFTYAYNTGLTVDDVDLNDGYHAAVPNGYAVSDPGVTAALLGLAVAGIERMRRRVNKGA